MSSRSSRLAGFYQLPTAERQRIVADWAKLGPDDVAALNPGGGLPLDVAEHMIENVIGLHALPLGIATNFRMNAQDYLIPMAVEEPSIVAAVSNSAKVIREGGGFFASSTPPVMIGQLQVLDLHDLGAAIEKIHAEREALLATLNDPGLSIVKRGGGARDLQTRPFPDTPLGPMLVLHLLVDVQEAMGANLVNTMCEKLAPQIENLTGGRANLRILSNLSDQRRAEARCIVPAASLSTSDLDGHLVVERIIEAATLAEIDPYRAATHNKGIMNGIDALAIATGQDWRAIEAGAHAYAARHGRYTSMSEWRKTPGGDLQGRLELPMAVGLVGGAVKTHPTVATALIILGLTGAAELAKLLVCVGLAQNLGAIRALATEGIQRGHMELHARQIAISAGASPEQVAAIAAQMIAEKAIRPERARELLQQKS
jgi:hydroxymethylglutaryl-CoA reductase